MKASNNFLCLVSAVALAVEGYQAPSAVAPSPSLPNITPPVPLPNIQTPRSKEEESKLPLDARQMVQIANPGVAKPPAAATTEEILTTTVVDQWPEPSSGSIGLGTLTASAGVTKSLRARSEGTLGQTPWIGMAIGLTCTALAAVMLG
ncbi:hypothetical protein ETB97_009667 [Aspergillus alliaceus]|uniref:Uncharacterized protein n=1 Tax=Petromyces alliaceus TaxID=209559 RepID=A0A5N7C3I9_PETAA|nr:hypothetical protein BDV23DRAFT_158524 [Aspergillus alliaceus]KAF5855208.1 hypothetical protein ETB97_009667 [Aspergillus burnettii]